MYLSFYCNVCVWEGVGDRTKTAIYWPTLMAISVVSFSFSWCSTGGPGAQILLSYGFLYCIWSPTGLQNSIGGSEGPFGRVWLFLPHLVYNSLMSNSSGARMAPFAGLSLPHLISNLSGPQLFGFLSSQSYRIVQHPLNYLLNLWNGMFDRHQAEITVMQFTGHSLPVHQSMSVTMIFYLVPFHQPNPPTRSLSITGYWNVLSLPLEWHVWPRRRSKYNKIFLFVCVCGCVCVWVTKTNTTKKDYLTKVSCLFWLRISTVCFFLWFDEISMFEEGKRLTEKVQRGRAWLHGVYIFVAVDCWK